MRPLNPADGQQSLVPDDEWRHGVQPRDTISTTVNEDVKWITRVPLVVSNLVIMMITFTVFWATAVAALSRPREEGGFWGHLAKNAFFTMFMHLEVPLMIVSGVLFTASSFGLVGSLRENVRLLAVYNVFLLVFVVMVSASVITVCFFQKSIKNRVKSSYFSEFILGYRDNADFQRMVDGIQQSLRCCGITDDNFRDWNLNPYFRCQEDNPSRERCNVPYSCCRHITTYDPPRSTLCGAKVLSVDDKSAWERIYVRSCADAAVTSIKDNIAKILVVCFALNFVFLLLLTTSVHLSREIKLMAAIYDVYYQTLIEGQEKMKDMGVPLPQEDTNPRPTKPSNFWDSLRKKLFSV